jgi:Na+/H+-dicarboxylate symporter
MKLHTKVLIGMGAGLVVGLIAGRFPTHAVSTATEWMSLYGHLFIRLIAMLVVPLVISSMMVGITAIGDLRTLGKLGARTVGFFLVSTLLASVIGLLVAVAMHAGSPTSLTDSGGMGAFVNPVATDAAIKMPDALLNMVPANPIGSAASGDLFGVILFTLLFGSAIGALPAEKRDPVVRFFAAISDACSLVIGWIMKLAPAAVFCLIASVMARFGLGMLRALSIFCLTVVLGLLIQAGIVFSLVLLAGCRRSPVWFYRNISDVALVAFSTSSSSATLPLSITAAEEKLGVPVSIASFVLPLGATMNKNGSALYKAAAVVFITQMAGVHLGWPLAFRIVLAATLSAMTTAGIPGSGLVAIVVVLQMAGLGGLAPIGSVLVAGVDRILDMLRTTVNVIGSLLCATFLAAHVDTGPEAPVPVVVPSI